MIQTGLPDGFRWAALVPELLVSNLRGSLDFWCRLIGFSLAYERPAERFAYLHLGEAQVMIEERGIGRNWLTGPLDPPLGRGINLQIELADLERPLAALAEAEWPLFMPPEEKWYHVAGREAGQRQFLVQDPDGYLLRLTCPLEAGVANPRKRVGS